MTLAELAVTTAHEMKWMGAWLLAGILAMIVSIAGFYNDSPKIGNIAFVVMTFSFLTYISLLVLLLIKLQFSVVKADRDKEI
jgi:RsiW-degrading membrane proteinase PrsW (M82 family)